MELYTSKNKLRKMKISFTSIANCHLGSQEDQLEEITLGLSLLSIFVALIKTLKEIVFLSLEGGKEK